MRFIRAEKGVVRSADEAWGWAAMEGGGIVAGGRAHAHMLCWMRFSCCDVCVRLLSCCFNGRRRRVLGISGLCI